MIRSQVIREVSIRRPQIQQLIMLFGMARAKAMVKRVVYGATRKAMNAVVRFIRTKLNLAKKYISGPRYGSITMKVLESDGWAYGTVRIRHRRIPLIAFPTRGSKHSGVSVRIGKDRPAIKLRHAFLARVKSDQQSRMGVSHLGVFERTKHLPTKGPNMGKGGFGPNGRVWRLAIEERFGPSVMDLIKKDEFNMALTKDMAAILRRELDSQVSRVTKGEFRTLEGASRSGIRFGERTRNR